MLVNSIISFNVFSLINILSVSGAVFCLFFLLKPFFEVQAWLLVGLLNVSLIAWLWDHTPPISYPVAYMLPFCFVSLAAFTYRKFIIGGNKKWVLISVPVFWLSVLSYEVISLLMLLIYLLFIVSTNLQIEKRSIYSWKLHFIQFAIFPFYAGANIIWSFFYGASYYNSSGFFWPGMNKFSLFILEHGISGLAIKRIIEGQTWRHFSVDGEILQEWHLYLGALWENLTWTSTGIAILSGALSALITYKWRPKNSTLLKLATIGFLIAIAPNVLFAFSSKYQNWFTQGVDGYVGTRYAFFGVIFIIVGTLALFIRAFACMPKLRTFLLFSIIFILTHATTVNNMVVRKSMLAQSAKWRAANLLAASAEMPIHLDGRKLYGPQFWEHVHIARIRVSYWQWQNYWTKWLQAQGANTKLLPPTRAKEADFIVHFDRKGSRIERIRLSPTKKCEGEGCRLLIIETQKK